MSHIRIFEHPANLDAFGAACRMAIIGSLANAAPGEAYEGRLSISGSNGDVSLLWVDGELPVGAAVSIDNATKKVVVTWPAYQEGVGVPVPIPNADFEAGDRDWIKGAGWSVVQNDVNDDPNTPSSQWTARYAGQSGSIELRSALRAAVVAGQAVSASCRVQQGASSEGNAGAAVRLFFQPASGAEVMREGNLVDSGSNSEWKTSTLNTTAPVTGTVQVGCRGKRHRQNKPLWVDNFAWSLTTTTDAIGTNLEGVVGPITIRVRDAMGCEAEWTGSIQVSVTIARSLRPKIVSWWDFEEDLSDKARGGNDFAGTVAYELNDTLSGNRLAIGAAPISTTSNRGYNLHNSTNLYTDCAFGARIKVSKLTDCNKLITVGLDDGANVLGAVSIGITAGKWKASIYDVSGVATSFAAASVAGANIGADTHVGLNMVWGGSTLTTLELWVDGVMVASHVAAGNIYANRSTFVVGTREGGGYRPAIAEMFWAHDSLSAAEWAWLANAGTKRLYSEFGSVDYGTTYAAAVADAVGSAAAGIYALNGSAGNVATNPIADVALVGGAAYSPGGSPPAGLGVSQVVVLDGLNDRVETAEDAVSFAATPLMMAGWFKQTAEGDAGDMYLCAGSNDASQPSQFRRMARQATSSGSYEVAYSDASGNQFSSGAYSGASRVDAWHFLAYGGTGNFGYPIVDGLVVAEPFYYASFMQALVGRFIAGSAYNGSNAAQGYMSSLLVMPSGNLRLSVMAKLYDLGMGVG